MSERKGDWRDLLSAYHLALKGNKIWVGFLTLIYVLLAMVAASILYSKFADWGLVPDLARTGGLVALGHIGGHSSLIDLIWQGRGLEVILRFLPLLNPFYGHSLGHLVVSLFFYLLFFVAVTGNGGVISRLTALEYARQDFPTLRDARSMVKSKRTAYFLAPLWPFLFVVVPLIGCAVIGLFCSIPFVGRVLMVPLYLLVLVFGMVALLFGLGWVFGFGMMMPALSVGGKDAFDAWSTPYAYVLWQFGRYLCYTLLLGAIGVLAAFAAHWLVELFVWITFQATQLGFLSSVDWIAYEGIDLGWFAGVLPFNAAGRVGAVSGHGGLVLVVSSLVAVMTVVVKALPLAYVISYFFTGNTLMFFLLRKRVDNIDIEEIYEEAEEEAEFPLEEEMGEPGLTEEEPADEEAPVPEPEEEEPEHKPEEPEPEEPEGEPEEEEQEEEDQDEAEEEQDEEGEGKEEEAEEEGEAEK